MPFVIPAALEPVLGNRYPHRPRVMFLLKKRADAGHTAFEQALRDWRRAHPYEVTFGTICARAGIAIGERQAQIDGHFRQAGIKVEPYDGYVSLDIESYKPGPADFETLLASAADCLAPLSPVVDMAASAAVAGIANLVIPGTAPLTMILVLDRQPHLSVEQYNAWWVHHAEDHRRLNPAQVGYVQFHNAPETNAAAAVASGVPALGRCIVDVMHLADLGDAFPKAGSRTTEEAKSIAADIGAHVSSAWVGGSFFREL